LAGYNVPEMATRLPSQSRMLWRLSVLLVTAVCCGCFATYHPPDWTRIPRTSGLEPSTKLVDLTADERETLCVWKVTVFGGFGKRYGCGKSRRVSTYTRDDCRHVKAPPQGKCVATVAEDERCAVRLSSNACVDWGSVPECTIVRRCWG
jgi:hypothetical protein